MAQPVRHPVAARRILRLALGTALSLGVSQAFSWQLSFIAPVMTLLILALPLPAPGLKKGLGFVIALSAPMIAGVGLLPFLMHARWVGIVLVALALFFSFYYTARGGAAVLGTFMTVGLTLVVTIGSVNSAVLVALIQALAVNAVLGMVFVWLAHALLPDLPPDPVWKAFPMPHEIVGMGSIASRGGEPSLHLHSSLGRGTEVLTGCIRKEGKVFLVVEAMVMELLGARATRARDERSGLELLSID